METQIEIWAPNSNPPQRDRASEGLHNMHSEPMPRGNAVLQSDQNHSRKARPSLRCSECGKAAAELYIVRIEGEVCERCLTPEDVVRYPEFARQIGLIEEGKAA